MSADEPVFFVSTKHQVFHLSRDCPRLDTSYREPVETTRAEAEGLGKTVCKFCAGDVKINRSLPQNSLAAKLDAADPEEVSR